MQKLLTVVAILFPFLLHGQGDNWPGTFFRGYSSSIKGGGFQYHSPQPDVSSALLLRSVDSVQYIEWVTDPVPYDYEEPKVNFVWMFGIDANIDSHAFKLFVNGKYCLTFYNPLVSNLKPWRVDGTEGCSLYFRTNMMDKYEDLMGYAVLSLPVTFIEKGKPQQIRIVGESKQSRSWYMTFESGVEEKLTIRQVPAVVREEGENAIPVSFQFIHLGEPEKGYLKIDDNEQVTFTLETGFNEVKVLLPEMFTSDKHIAQIAIQGKKPFSRNFVLLPPRHFTIYLVQHTHTDIGYTRPQTEILPDHLRYIDYALDFCDLTDSFPDDARFRWSCETSWAVREFIRTRPAHQVERLLRRVNEGRIEITGLFLNSSDLADETMIAATLLPVRELRDSGFPVRAAMQSDINGVPWCLTDYLSGAGIEYLNMAQNTHRADKPFDKPTTFWWESPSGNRIIVYRPEHYMWGNSLGILAGSETFGKGLFQHLLEISEKGFPFDHYAIQFSGYLTDNSPPSTIASKMVESWNKTYVWPKLRLATISEYPDYIKKNHASELPVIRGAWPDWWMDGFGSAAIQTAFARKTHADYIANQGLMSMASLLGAPQNQTIRDLHAQITDDIAFYDEHTFGAAESITDPLCENSIVQLGEKEAYVWSAVKKNHLLREEVMGLVQPYLPKSDLPTITVFNTLNWVRSGNTLVYIDHQLLPKNRKFHVMDAAGQSVALQQVSSREEGSWWMLQVKDLLPLGFSTYRIVVDEAPRTIPTDTPFEGILENDFYHITVDPENKKIIGFHDKELNIDLLDRTGKYSAGEVIYERLGKNRGQLEQRKLDEFTRQSWSDLRVSDIHRGAVFQSIFLHGRIGECADPSGIHCEIRLYNHEKKVSFCYSMKKLPVADPEGVYVAFPFTINNGHHVVEVAGGTMIPGKEQIEGSASDWTGIQNFTSLRSDSGQIVFVSPEIPLVQLGNINLGEFFRVPNPGTISTTEEAAMDRKYPASGSIFSWVLNNYWTTNFLASQQGELKWSYHITSMADPSNNLATRFGMENRIPILTRVLTASGISDTTFIPQSFYTSVSGNVVLISMRPDISGRGILLQMRETTGKADSIPIEDQLLSSVTLVRATRAKSVSEVNVLEEPLKVLWEQIPSGSMDNHRVWVAFKPYETKFILIRI